ncbi:MAG: hypothetical protein J6W73_05340 [Verrucomicrobia bacterium]|nr:hypothetical protein [Verrucomicrobiota bacterium]
MNRNSIKTAGIFAMLLSVSFFFVPALFAAADSEEGDGLIYQWYKNGKAIFGATGPEYTIESADEADIGTYTVKVINRVGEEISLGAELTVEGAVPYEKKDLSYQWYKNGKKIFGATQPDYTIESVGQSDVASYAVEVINRWGETLSNEAALVVSDLLDYSELDMTYQWYKDGKKIFGATEPTYTIASAEQSDVGAYTVKVACRTGEEISSPAILTLEGGIPYGGMDLGYQWYKDGKAIFGATGPEYTIESVERNDIGLYTVKVINRLDTETSAGAWLTIDTDFAYQWYKDGKAIPGATGSSYVIESAALDDSGDYSVLVSNDIGSTMSANALLTVEKFLQKLIVRADDLVRIYGLRNPELTYTITDLDGNEVWVDGEPDISTPAVWDSPAGTYPIIITKGTLADEDYEYNYEYIFENGVLTVKEVLPPLSFEMLSDGSGMVLTYTKGTLYESDDTVTWTLVENAESPFVMKFTEKMKFYRLEQ